MSRLIGALGASIVAAALFAATAGAEWQFQPLPIAKGGDLGDVEVVTDANGRSTVVWRDTNGENDAYRFRRVEADGTLGPVADLSSAASGDSRELSMDVGPGGEVIAVWVQGATLPNEQIRLRRIGPDGGLGAIETISAADSDTPVIDVGASGDGYVAWWRNDGGDTEIEGRAVLATGELGAIRPFTAAAITNANSPRVAINPSGMELVIWNQATMTEGELRASRVTLGGVPEASSPLAGGGSQQVSSAAVAARPDGGFLFVFTLHMGAPDFEMVVQRRTVPAAGGPSPAADVSSLGAAALATVLAVAPNGVATAVWTYRKTAEEVSRLQARRILPSGDLGPLLPFLSSDVSAPQEWEVGVDADGNVTALWARENPLFEILTRQVLADGTLAPASELVLAAPSAANPREANLPGLGVAPGGAALATFLRAGGGQPERQVQAMRFVPPPPPAAEPSNRFRFGKLKRNKRRGTAILFVHVPAPGRLVLAKTKKVKGAAKQAQAAGKVRLRIRPRGKAKRRLLKRAGGKGVGRLKVTVRVTFTPDGGSARTKTKRLSLVKR
jgi:hypothetical protein